MLSFIKKISANATTLEFSFTRIYTVNGTKYFITVIDRELHSYIFKMEQIAGIWKIMDLPVVPQWIHAVEYLLGSAIMQHPE